MKPKILWIYKYSAQYNLDKWFHLEYVRWIKNNGYSIVAYGPDIHKEYSDLVEVKYSPNITWDELLYKTKADVAILNTKSRMFDHYSPHAKEARGCILPIGFERMKLIPRIILEEDSHYESDGKWYQEVGIDLLLQRHCSQAMREWGVPTRWLPFSVDEQIFKPTNTHRTNKVCFAGHITTPYPERRAICNALKPFGFIDVFEHKEKVNQAYIDCLNAYKAHLSTPSIYDITAAKNFEIMSSGSILITPKFTGIDSLFSSNSYLEITQEDCVEKISSLLSNNELQNELATNGRKCILENHTNKIRTEQMLEMIKCL